MLKIRLKRVGRRNDPSYRIIVTEGTRGPKSGDVVEQIGFYNPKTKERSVDGVRVTYWMEHGARPSDTVYNMLVDEKVIDGKKKNALPRKSPVVKEQPTTDNPQPTTGAGTEDATAEAAGTGEEKKEEKEEKPPESAPAQEEVPTEKGEAQEEETKEKPADESSSVQE